jgi:hypothetical protein
MNTITDPAAGIVAEAASPVKKTCTKCGVEKVLEEFHLDKKGGKFGRHHWCKVCKCAHVHDYAQRPEAKKQRGVYDQRPEVKEQRRAYKQRPEYKKWERAYKQSLEYQEWVRAYKQSPEYKEWWRAYRQRPEHKEWRRAYLRAYRQRPESKKWKRDYERNYVRDRYRTDPTFKLMHNLRRRVQRALKGTCKSARTLGLLGCTVEEFRAHLESQFKPGMTWENQGYCGWHVDHIRPCASFDLTDPEQQRICFHYTNLQPLWAEENMRKGAKFGLSPQALDATVPPCSPPSSPHYGSNGDTDPGAICSTEPRGCS